MEEEDTMCMSCGCGSPNDNHGDERSITQDDLDRAAQAANVSRDQAAQNVMDCCQQVSATESRQEQRGAGQGAPA